MNVVIEKIEISSFGKLKNTFVNLENGINLLSAPNESGKSTLAAFIKFVFYGFAGTRAHTLAENERKFYAPWGGESVAGTLTLTADGTRYTVFRSCPPSGRDSVRIINRATGSEEFLGAIPGEVFFGVGEDIFARTLFFRQLTLPQSKDELLAERLRNITISADEQVGTKKAVERLKDCKNDLVGKAGKGLIPALVKEREDIDAQLALSVDMRRDADKLRAEIKTRTERIAENNQKLDALTLERENIDKYNAYLKLENINRLAALEREALEDLKQTSALIKNGIDAEGLARLSSENTLLVAERRNAERLEKEIDLADAKLKAHEAVLKVNDVGRLENLKKRLRRASICFALFLTLALVLLAASAVTFFTSKACAALLLACAAVCGGLSLVFMARKNPKRYRFDALGATGFANDDAFVEDDGGGLKALDRRISRVYTAKARVAELKSRISDLEAQLAESKNKIASTDEKLRDIIERHIDVNGDSENLSARQTALNFIAHIKGDDITDNIEKIRLINAEILRKQALYDAKRQELDFALDGTNLKALESLAQGATKPLRDRAAVDPEIEFYTQQNTKLYQLNRDAELECASLEAKSGDPSALVGKRNLLDDQISKLTLKHSAYETAIKLIEEASDSMKSRVAPQIAARADKYFSVATGGKYRGLELDTRLSMSVGENFKRSCDQLSAGTRDSAYLSLRLALADMLFDGCGVPMLLDDAFVRIDDSRLAMLASALDLAAQKHQIIILTHSDREAFALSAAGAKYSEISMKTV